MLSLGTEFFLAFWMASYSVGLPAGSPPPTRAATSMFLINRANILPRRASMTAFLCLVVAHFEWPLIAYYLFLYVLLYVFLHVFLYVLLYVRSTSLRGLSGPTADDVDEQLVDAAVAGHLRMERRRQHRALPHGHDMAGGPAEHPHARTDPLDPRRPDEHRVDGRLQAVERDVALERV